ncbi:hypothetical protein HGRIS_011566 [Hohenbuehelia grisea]|uniref:Nuclear pore complex protein NUP96 C-terminal domain-containing protein n=1 Tax=Hohenbuehelia grisea TaxID=104357 RepID=A0ABR3JVG8_9AGAR
MARFRAYTSDSSDDDSEQEQPQVQPEEPPRADEPDASSSSDMDEDELLPSPRRKRQRRVEIEEVDEDDSDEGYVHPMRHRGGSRRASASPPPTNRVDPTLTPFAQHVGVDSQRMMVMQTSLFRMPEEAAAIKATNKSAPRNVTLQPPVRPTRKHPRESDSDFHRVDSRERASFGHDIDLLPHRPSRKYARVETSESAVVGTEGAIVDAGLALGRSFRVGWGPGGTLVHCGKICGPFNTLTLPSNTSSITKAVVPFAADSTAQKSLSSLFLQHQLTNSPIEPDDDGIPSANPSASLCFASFANLFTQSDQSYEASLFRLGHALFDDLDLRLGSSITPDIRNRVACLRRKTALASWLAKVVAPSVERAVKASTSVDSPAAVFALLTGNQIEQATDAAMDGGNFNLATLVSQAGGDDEFREDLRLQLHLWREQRIDAHIDDDIRKIYALLAGCIDEVLEGSKGTGFEQCSNIDLLQGLDWKRVFGLHLWFSESLDSTIADVYEAYGRLLKDSPARGIAKPEPWYKSSPSSSSQPSWKLHEPLPPDALYSLIRLHAEPSCSLSQVLNPLSFGPSPVDQTLPWHLYIILSRCMRARDFDDRGDPGTGRDEEPEEDEEASLLVVEGHSPSADLLTSSYALQLERAGMLQEAVFVLLHIEGSRGREKAIKDLLARVADQLDEWNTRAIVGSLKIPMAWVNEAKAIFALSSGRIFEAYELYLSAGLFNAAHDIAISELAPDAIVRRDYELLRSVFSRFASHSVNGWHVRGKVLLDYARVMTRLPELHEKQTTDASEIDELARTAARVIGLLPDVLNKRSDARHTAALAEMIASLVLEVEKVRPSSLTQVHLTHAGEATKMRHIQYNTRDRFLQSIAA